MSLLLDALQRASKDKADAAAAQHAPSTQAPAPQVTPSTIAPVSVPASTPAPAEQSLSLEMPEEVLSLEPTTPPALVQSAPVQPLTLSEPVAVPAAAGPTVNKGKPAATPTPATPSAGRVAQDMRRAYAPVTGAAQAKARRRIWALGAVATVLGAAVAIVFSGAVGDPTRWFVSSSLQPVAAPPVSPAPIAAHIPAPTSAPSPVATSPEAALPAVQASAQPPLPPMVRAAPTEEGKTKSAPAHKEIAPPAPAKALPPKPASAPEVPVVAEVPTATNTPAGIAFSSKTRGPSALEQGYAALVEGRLNDAEQAYGQALAANSQERDALIGLAYIAQQRGQTDEAKAYYARVLRTEPDNAAAKAGLLALNADGDGNLSATKARELAQSNPNSAPTMAMVGAVLVREGLLADAQQVFARAQLLEPSNAQYAYNHAVALDRLGQYELARVHYERTLVLLRSPQRTPPRGFTVATVEQRLAQLRQATQPAEKP